MIVQNERRDKIAHSILYDTCIIFVFDSSICKGDLHPSIIYLLSICRTPKPTMTVKGRAMSGTFLLLTQAGT